MDVWFVGFYCYDFYWWYVMGYVLYEVVLVQIMIMFVYQQCDVVVGEVFQCCQIGMWCGVDGIVDECDVFVVVYCLQLIG